MGFLINSYAFESGAPPAVPWSLDDINVALYYNANDPATVTLVSSAISQLLDKSQNSHTLTMATSTRRPTLGTIGGKTSIVWDGVDDALLKTTAVELHSGPWTAFAVMKGVVANTGILLSQQTALGVAQYLRNATDKYACVPFAQGPIALGANSPVAADFTAAAVVTTRFTGERAVTSLDGVDGTPNTGWTTAPLVGPDQISLGDYLASAIGTPFGGESGPVILICGGLSTPMRQRFEGLLAHAYGTQGALDPSHPYKAAPPNEGHILPTTWTARTLGFGASAALDVRNFARAGARLFVAGGFANNLATSPDGVTWTARTSGLSGANNINAIGCDHLGNLIVVNDASTPDLARSTDGGATWSTQTMSASFALRAVAHDLKGTWVVAGDGGFLRSSTNGTSWTTRTSTFGATRIWCMGYGGGLWVIGGEEGKIATSTSGTSWTARTSGFGASIIRGACWANGMYVIVGQDGKIATSRDGTTWTMRTSGTAEYLLWVRYADGGYWAGGSNGTLIYSENGIDWSPVTNPLSGNLRPVAYDENATLTLAGSAGELYTASRPATA